MRDIDARTRTFVWLMLFIVPGITSCGSFNLGPFEPDQNIIGLELLDEDAERVQFQIGSRQWYPVLANSTRHYDIYWRT